MSRLHPACDQLITGSAANNVAWMREAAEAIVQLVKHCMGKLTTTMNQEVEVVAKGQPGPALGHPGVPTVQVMVPPLLLPLGTPIQWGPITAAPNPAPVPQKHLPAINEPQAQGEVIPGAVLAQAPVFPGLVQGEPQPQAQGQVVLGLRRQDKWLQVSFRVTLHCKRKAKLFLSFGCQEKLLLVSFRVNLDRKHKHKSFLSFRRQDKSLQVAFRVNLSRRATDKSFLSSRRKHKSLQVSRRLNLNH